MKTLTTSLVACAVAAASAFAVVGCDRPTDASTTTTTSGNPPVMTGDRAGADNTRLNARDNKTAAVTPMDQGNNQADLNTTQAIRKALMADDSLSTDAKNIKVVTSSGSVTLRGPVKSDAEKNNIDAKAKANAGTNQVVDQLDIEAKP